MGFSDPTQPTSSRIICKFDCLQILLISVVLFFALFSDFFLFRFGVAGSKKRRAVSCILSVCAPFWPEHIRRWLWIWLWHVICFLNFNFSFEQATATYLRVYPSIFESKFIRSQSLIGNFLKQFPSQGLFCI